MPYGNFSRFLPREIKAARATSKARLEELLILTLRCELRMADAVRTSRLRELLTPVYGDEPDQPTRTRRPRQRKKSIGTTCRPASWPFRGCIRGRSLSGAAAGAAQRFPCIGPAGGDPLVEKADATEEPRPGAGG